MSESLNGLSLISIAELFIGVELWIKDILFEVKQFFWVNLDDFADEGNLRLQILKD